MTVEDMANKTQSSPGNTENNERMDEGADEKANKIISTREETTKTSSKGPVRFGMYLDAHKAEKARKKKKKKA